MKQSISGKTLLFGYFISIILLGSLLLTTPWAWEASGRLRYIEALGAAVLIYAFHRSGEPDRDTPGCRTSLTRQYRDRDEQHQHGTRRCAQAFVRIQYVQAKPAAHY